MVNVASSCLQKIVAGAMRFDEVRGEPVAKFVGKPVMYKMVFGVLSALSLGATAAIAGPISPVSYSMANGWVYTDTSYSAGGGGDSLASLSNGLGKLTDGIVASGTWSTDTDAYVGWLSWFTPNPTVTFDFTGNPTINSIQIAVDNSGVGDVLAPGPIVIDGVEQTFSPPDLGTVGVITLSGLSLTGNQHTIQFMHNGLWVFVSEVSFSGASAPAVPEPASWAMMIGGFSLVGASMRYRKRSVRFA